MSKMSYSSLTLFVDNGVERTFVVDAKVENAVLIGEFKRG